MECNKCLSNCSFRKIDEEDILEKELRERKKEELIRIRKSLEMIKVTEEKNTKHTNT